MNQQESPSFNDRIELDALTPAYKMAHKTTFPSLLAPAIVMMVMWQQIDHGILIGWGMLVVAVLLVQYLLTGSFLRNEVQSGDVKKWGRRISAVYFAFGLLWVAAVFLFTVDVPAEYQLFLLTLVVAFSIGTIMVGQHWSAMYYMYGPITLAAVVVRLIMEDSFAYTALAGLLLLLGVGSVLNSRVLHNMMRSEMRLRYKSEALADALHRSTQEAQQATQAKSKFLAAASHDLRQPLHALSLFIDVLKESKSEEAQASIFPRVDQSMDALIKLLDALLDISRLDAKVVKPEFSHFDISGVLKIVEDEFTVAVHEKNLKLKLCAKSLVVISDRLLLERILRNLVSNAIRYTDAGGILISARERNDCILLQVWDTGSGIPQESKDEIFVEFQQLNNAHRDRTQGLGLGLAIVRRLCKLMGYPLALNSQYGKGSVFSISIPRGDVNLVPADRMDRAAHQWDLSGRCILVIDDEREILYAMQALLTRWGCEVVLAESLEDAIQGLNKNKTIPDLILSDMRLRDNKTGVEAIDRVREKFGSSVTGILITGETLPEQIKLAEESGYEVLKKPVQPMRLRTVIHHALSNMAKRELVNKDPLPLS